MNIKYTSLLSLFCIVPSHAAKLPEKYKFSKNTCNRTWYGPSLSTDEERKKYPECSDSRFEVYDQIEEKHVAHIAYKPTNDPSECTISYLLVDDEHQGKGIGRALTKKALKDLKKHGCKKINISSTTDSIGFWEKLGAKPKGYFNAYVLSDPKENFESFSVEKLIFFTDL